MAEALQIVEMSTGIFDSYITLRCLCRMLWLCDPDINLF